MIRMLGRSSVIVLGLLLAACLAPTMPPQPDGPPQVCTQIGCESHILFELGVDLQPGMRYEIEACVDGECTSESVVVDPNGFSTVGAIGVDAHRDTVGLRLLGDDYSGTHQVSLSIVGPGMQISRITEAVEFERVQPNGPGCEPVCWQAVVSA